MWKVNNSQWNDPVGLLRFHARLHACHKIRRHKDTRHIRANRIFTVPDKMRFVFLALRLFQTSVSALIECILHFCTSKKILMRTGANCLDSPLSFILDQHASELGEMNCVPVLNKQAALSIYFYGGDDKSRRQWWRWYSVGKRMALDSILSAQPHHVYTTSSY